MLTFKDVVFSNRDEWLRWRMTGIGSSDAPIIMNDSDYSTPLKLWDVKLLPFPKEMANNYATDKGNEAEPKIRSLCELDLGESFAAVCMEGIEFPILISLDGRSKCKTKNLEIKLINRKDWEAAKAGMKAGVSHNKLVPQQYKAQVQHQFFYGAKKCYFAMYLFDAYKKNPLKLTLENLVILEVVPEPEYMGQMLQEHTKFWDCVKKRKPPVAGDKDYEPLTGVAPIAKKWLKAKEKAEKAAAELEEARDALITAAKAKNHPRLICAGIRIALISKIGNVDYSVIPELNGVDLDKYRKPGSASWTLTPIKQGGKNGSKK